MSRGQHFTAVWLPTLRFCLTVLLLCSDPQRKEVHTGDPSVAGSTHWASAFRAGWVRLTLPVAHACLIKGKPETWSPEPKNLSSTAPLKLVLSLSHLSYNFTGQQSGVGVACFVYKFELTLSPTLVTWPSVNFPICWGKHVEPWIGVCSSIWLHMLSGIGDEVLYAWLFIWNADRECISLFILLLWSYL